MQKPKALRPGDTVGIVAPCWAISPEQAERVACGLRELGLHTLYARHLFSQKSGYAGSIEERVADFHSMVADDSVRMVLFGGGEVCNELLPYLDYESIARHPKLYCSYSDSTTLLNAIHTKCDLVTFYGASLRTFADLTEYNRLTFVQQCMQTTPAYTKSAPWRTICPGRCEGALAGGYLVNYAALYGLPYYPQVPETDCILFLEDHEKFSQPAVVSKWLANLEHRGVFQRVRGLIFGHYSEREFPQIDGILRDLGMRYGIPVVRCEDFGHGAHTSVLPIGVSARLDTAADCFELLESGVGE